VTGVQTCALPILYQSGYGCPLGGWLLTISLFNLVCLICFKKNDLSDSGLSLSLLVLFLYLTFIVGSPDLVCGAHLPSAEAIAPRDQS